jgi:sterol desaturase/sphingolipid hydroxylase (fatty acid hydroxylase superfamily)
VSRVAYPILLIAVVVPAIAAMRLGWDFGQVNFLFVLSTITYLSLLERVIPYDPAWHPGGREWGWYGIYFVLTVIGGAMAQFVVMAVVGVVAPLDPVLPLGAEIPSALLLGSIGGYAVHRLAHNRPWLWRLHGVHHAPDKVNVGNNGVAHVLDILITQACTQVVLALIGFSEESVFVVGLFVVAQGYFLHANIDVRLGWLNYVFVSPEQHRLHHSTDLSEAGHYGSDLSIWDLLFGTFTWYPGRKPVQVGLADPASFPKTSSVVASQLQAFRRRAKAVDTSA